MTDKPDEILDLKEGTPALSSVQALQFDADEYRDDLKALGLTQQQENEILNALWHIMSGFVDLGWGVDSVQLFLPELFGNVAQDSAKLLDSKDCNKGEKE